MQTFRAYVQDAAGTITWAAWIEAAHLDDAQARANALSPHPGAVLELWALHRETFDASRLEPV